MTVPCLASPPPRAPPPPPPWGGTFQCDGAGQAAESMSSKSDEEKKAELKTEDDVRVDEIVAKTNEQLAKVDGL